jgi:hypothetical protein
MNEISTHDFESFAQLGTESVGVNFIQNNVTFFISFLVSLFKLLSKIPCSLKLFSNFGPHLDKSLQYSIVIHMLHILANFFFMLSK